MLQNPFAVRPSYTTLNALQLVHDPIPTLHGPSTILSQRSRIRLQFRHNAIQPFCDALQRVHDPFYSFVTTLYDTFAIPSQRPTTLLRRSTTRPRSLLQFRYNVIQPSYNALRHVHNPITTLYDPSTVSLQRRTTPLQHFSTRSRSRFNALPPFCSYLTTSYTPSTTL